jgi:puromycin-sensitive aminopeptidase
MPRALRPIVLAAAACLPASGWAQNRGTRAPLTMPSLPAAMPLTSPVLPGVTGTAALPAALPAAALPGAAAAAAVPALPSAAWAPSAPSAPVPSAPGISANGRDVAAEPALRSMAAGVSKPHADAPAALAAGFDGSGKAHECAACAAAENGIQGGSSAAPPAQPPAAPPVGRLPETIKPKRYDLRLSLEPEAGTFRGKARVEAAVSKPVDRVVLHALDLAFTEVRVNGKAVDPARVVVDAKSETVTILLDAPLKKGAAVFDFAYEGKMSELMRGLFRATGSHQGKPEAWTFTHLEPTHARRVLPSFDEPSFKARFKLTIDAPEHLVPISNMPVAERTVENGRVVASFDESPKMSSYLLAVFAARLQPRSRKVGKTLVTVWAPAEQIDQVDFALESAARALKALEKYFGMPYQLPKLDLVVSPEFASGAMENWGAILFRDVNVLVDPTLTSDLAKRRVAEVVSHEIAHQWFGNLVTMKWWNDLWLNEAFATWVAAKVVDSYTPEWKTWDDFDAGKRAPMSIDALPGTNPVRSDAQNPAQIQALFDGITYQKGGALLRMLEDWIGERDFRRGLQAYMKRYAYKNAEANDLWREIERVSGKPVRRVAGAWLSQAGVPLVTVEPGEDSRTLRLSQRRFSAMGEAPDTLWPIPVAVRYRLAGEKKTRVVRVLLDGRSAEVRLPGPRGAALLWAYPNAEETGYYRLRVEGPLLKALADHRAELSAIERAGLLNNMWARVRAGTLPVDQFLDALARFGDGRSRLVLEDAAGYLKALRNELASSDEERAALASFARRFFAPHAKRLGWAPRRGEDDDAAMGRPAVLSALALHGAGASFAAELAPRLKSYLADPASVDPAVAPVVLAAAARRNEPELFARFRALLAEPRTPEQRDVMLKALSEFTAPELVDRYLAMTLSPEIRQQDAWKPYVWLLGNPLTRERAWAFTKAHWGELLAKVGPRGATRVVGAAAGLVSHDARADVESFFRSPAHEVEMARKTLDQALSAIDLGLAFQQAQRRSFARWAASQPK